jgi:hypothetical protein
MVLPMRNALPFQAGMHRLYAAAHAHAVHRNRFLLMRIKNLPRW